MNPCYFVLGVLLIVAAWLQGCGGGPSPTTTTTTTPGPLRAIAYGPLPLRKQDTNLPSADVVQDGNKMQWGTDGFQGRDDLANIKAMGANTVRLYHSFGLETKHRHSGFLDRAEELGLKVMPGMHSEPADIRLDPAICGKDWNCFTYAKNAFLKGLQYQGYARDGKWHPSIKTIVLSNELDFLDYLICCPAGNQSCGIRWCSNKLILSAFDGLLAAEKEAGINAGNVGVSACMSLATRTSIDGKVAGPGIFGFQDVDVITQNTNLAHYSPVTDTTDLRAAFLSRWEHCVNVATYYHVFADKVQLYHAKGLTFGDRPWFLGEAAFSQMAAGDVAGDFTKMDADATIKKNHFIGFGVFQYQTSYWKDGEYEQSLGMFNLGDKVVGQVESCTDGGFYFYKKAGCQKWDVHCVMIADKPWPHGPGHEKLAQITAKAWDGNLNKVNMCNKSTIKAGLVVV